MMLVAKSSTTKFETMCGDFCLSCDFRRDQSRARQKGFLGPGCVERNMFRPLFP